MKEWQIGEPSFIYKIILSFHYPDKISASERLEKFVLSVYLPSEGNGCTCRKRKLSGSSRSGMA